MIAPDNKNTRQVRTLLSTTILHTLSRILDRCTLYLNVLGSGLIIAVMLLVNADVIGRNLFDHPVSGVPELVSLSIVAIVFLQVAHAFRCGHLTRTVALLNLLEAKSVRCRALLELALCAGACAIVIQVLIASWPLLIKAWVRNTYEGTIGNFTVAVWPVKLIIVIGCVALIAQILMRALASLYCLYYRLPLPDGRTDDQS